MKCHPQHIRLINTMNGQDLEKARELLKLKTKNAKHYQQQLKQTKSSIRALIDSYHLTAHSILSSKESTQNLRSKNNPLWTKQGDFTTALTFNPAPQYSKCFFNTIGIQYNLDNDGKPIPRESPSNFERWQHVAVNPYTCAIHFILVRNAISSELLGLNIKTMEQDHPKKSIMGK